VRAFQFRLNLFPRLVEPGRAHDEPELASSW
jgi:hypothetical protein